MTRGTALITGASSGIGRDFAVCCAQDGWDVVLVARTESALTTIAAALSKAHGVRATVVPADLTDVAAPAAIATRCQRDGIAIDALINNAGFGTSGPFATTDVAKTVELLQVNIVALTHLTRLLLPAMLQRRTGRVLNVASTAAYVPGPLMATYYASKAYVVSFTEALSAELAESGVTATVLCPGPTETNFAAVAGTGASNLFKHGVVMDAATVARAGYAGMMRGDLHVIPGLMNKLVAFSSRLAPRTMLAQIAKRLNAG